MGKFERFITITVALLLTGIAAWVVQARDGESEPSGLLEFKPVRSYWANKHNAPRLESFDHPTQLQPNTPVSSPSMLDDLRRPPVGLAVQAQQSPGIIVCGSGALGGTSWDYQSNDDNQQMIAVLPSGGEYVHFAWTHLDFIPVTPSEPARTVVYSTYSTTAALPLGQCGFSLAVGSPSDGHAGYPTVDVGTGDLGYLAFHAVSPPNQGAFPPGPHTTWFFNQAVPAFNIFGEEEFATAPIPEAIWPHVRIDVGGSSTSPGDDVFHMCTHPTANFPPFDNEIVYWRRIGGFGNVWEGPVVLDETADAPLNYHVAVDPTSEKIAVVYEKADADGLLDIGYLESPDNGSNWITASTYPNPVEPIVGPYLKIMDYSGSPEFDPQAWLECHGEYDNVGTLHCVWIEQLYTDLSYDCRLQHWDQINGTKTIKQAVGWPNVGDIGVRDLWLAQPNLAFGTGSYTCAAQSSQDFVYVSFEQYGGPTAAEATDVSASNHHNLELFLSISQDNGATFSRPENLTKTKTPGCDGTPGNECESERDPSLAHVVNDTLHLLYFVDQDAGDAPFGQGSWTFNPVMYYRIPCVDDAAICCPEIAPVVSVYLTKGDPDCDYNTTCTPPGMVIEDLIVENHGNAPLQITNISTASSAPWLSIAGPSSFVLPSGQSMTLGVTMDAFLVAPPCPGSYVEIININHNDPDPTVPNPLPIVVNFVVSNSWPCPTFVPMTTAVPFVASQSAVRAHAAPEGELTLNVSNHARQAGQLGNEGGLFRSSDGSYAIYDAGPIIGVPPSPDTLVYRNVYGFGNGHPGFVGVSELEIDSAAYGSSTGSATAHARHATVDGTIGLDAEYVFPQHPDSSDFVLINYTMYNIDTTAARPGLIIGQATDFDVVPSLNDVDSLQIGTQNKAAINSIYNLMYLHGVDTANHSVIGDRTATRFKAGITSIQCGAINRTWSGPSEQWLGDRIGGGFTEQYLYREMVNVGLEVLAPYDPDPEEDLHVVMVFDQSASLGQYDTLGSGNELHYCMAYVSSNVGTDDTDLTESVRKAWRYCFGWQDIPDTVFLPEGQASASIPYYASGSHEDGVANINACCGCLVTKISGDPELTVGGGAPGDCDGTIVVDQSATNATYTATFRVTDHCLEYQDDCSIVVIIGNGCDCPLQGDMNGDGFHDAVDLNLLIDALFFGGPDPQDPNCPTTRGDVTADGFADAVDLNYMIDLLFFGGSAPTDPCL